MKPKTLTLLLLMLPAILWAQRELVIEGPNDQVGVVALQVKSDFNPDNGTLKLTISGDETAECNALWFLEDATAYRDLAEYFKQHGQKLKLSTFVKDQIKFMNLSIKTALPVIDVKGAKLMGNPTIYTKTNVKDAIQKQILPLDNRSAYNMTLQVEPGVEQVDLVLHNPLLLFIQKGKSQLAFIGKDVTMSFDVKVDHCIPNASLLDQLKEYNAIFSKGEASLQLMKDKNDVSLGSFKSLLINELNQIDLKRFENTQCQEIDEALAAFKALMDRIVNFDTTIKMDAGGNGGGAANGGQATAGANGGKAGTPAVEDCNFKKVNEDLKSAVVKLNSYANDWMSATDPAVKQAKKVAFDSLVKETDAKVNALSPACKKKVDSTAWKNYEMAKKLIKN